MKTSNFITEMVSNGGKVSSKRVVLAVGCGLFIICSLTELFSPLSISDNTYNNIVYMIGVGAVSTASEKFGKSKDESKTD